MAYYGISKNYISIVVSLCVLAAVIFGSSMSASTPIQDGDVLKLDNSDDVYIVKTINNKKFKRLILNPEIFNSYEHLSWSDIKTVSQSTLAQYATSNLIKQQGDAKIYELAPLPNADTGTKHWVNITQSQFLALGFDPDSIYTVNHIEGSDEFYATGATRDYTYYPQLTTHITDSSWQYVISDGGRVDSGYSPTRVGDCVPRGIAIATQTPYHDVYQELQQRTELFKNTPQGQYYPKVCCEDGTNRAVYKAYLAELGWRYYHEEDKPAYTRLSLYSPELHQGTVMIIIDNHFFTMIDGVAYDDANIIAQQYKQNLNSGLYITGYFRKV